LLGSYDAILIDIDAIDTRLFHNPSVFHNLSRHTGDAIEWIKTPTRTIHWTADPVVTSPHGWKNIPLVTILQEVHIRGVDDRRASRRTSWKP
jgi:hypothetical protein